MRQDFGKSGGWSTSGKLSAGNPDRKVSLQVNFPIASNYTVQLGIAGGAALNNLLHTQNAEALVTWTVNGNSITRRVNVTNGTSLTGTGEAVKVEIQDVSIGPFPANSDYLATIIVTPGTRGSNKQPPTLKPVPSVIPVAAGANTTVMIPVDAGVISVHAKVVGPANTPIVDGDARIVEQNLGTNIYEFNPTQTDWVPILGGADRLLLLNASAFPIDFSLVFGIDG